MNIGSFGGAQQVTGEFQQFSTGATYSGGFAAPVGGAQQQSFGFSGFSSQTAAAPAGISAANCFYV